MLDATLTPRVQVPRPQVQTPKQFDGENAKFTYKDYITACRLYCASVYGAMYTMTQLLQTASSFLAGKAQAFALHDAERNANRDWQSWDSMMQNRWLDPNRKALAVQKICAITHHPTETAHEYNTRFDMHAADAELSLDPMTPTLTNMYLNGLQSDLRAAMLTRHNQRDLEAMTWAALCVTATDAAHALRKYLKTSVVNSGNRRGRKGEDDPDGDGTTRGKGTGRYSSGKNGKGSAGRGRGKGKGKGKSSKGKGKGSSNGKNNIRPARDYQTRQDYLRDGKCFDCGQQGHMAGDPNCPARLRNADDAVNALSNSISNSVFDRLTVAVDHPEGLALPHQLNDQASQHQASPGITTTTQVAGSSHNAGSSQRTLVLRPQPHQRGRQTTL